MGEHLTPEQIAGYVARSLEIVELLDVDDHLLLCGVCREQVEHAEAVVTKAETAAASPQSAAAFLHSDLLTAESEPLHLEYEHLVGHVEGTLTGIEREIAESHLELCGACRQEADDLRSFRARLSTFEPRVYAPVVPAKPIGWRERLAALWNRPPARLSLSLAGTAALILIGVWAGMRSISTNTSPEAGAPTGAGAIASNKRAPSEPLAGSGKPKGTDGEKVALNTGGSSYPKDLTVNASPTNKSSKKPANGEAQNDPGNNRVTVATVPSADTRSPFSRRTTAGERSNSTLPETDPTKLNPTKPNRGNAARNDVAMRQAVLTVPEQTRTQIAMLDVSGSGDLRARDGNETENTEPLESFRLTAPVREIINETKPLFRWQSPAKGAAAYRLKVYCVEKIGSETNLEKVVDRESLTAAEWKMEETASLERGKTYAWQVQAYRDGKQTGLSEEGRFALLEKEKAETLERARRESKDDPLRMGLLYAKMGLLSEAERAFKTLCERNPKSEDARKLLEQVRELRTPKTNEKP